MSLPRPIRRPGYIGKHMARCKVKNTLKPARREELTVSLISWMDGFTHEALETYIRIQVVFMRFNLGSYSCSSCSHNWCRDLPVSVHRVPLIYWLWGKPVRWERKTSPMQPGREGNASNKNGCGTTHTGKTKQNVLIWSWVTLKHIT